MLIYALNLQHTLEADWVLGTVGSNLLQGPLYPGSPQNTLTQMQVHTVMFLKLNHQLSLYVISSIVV